MNGFDKACAALAFALAVVLLVLGVVGLFIGCRAYFTLPPILGVFPALIGWGIFRSVRVAWQVRDEPSKYTRPGVEVLPPKIEPILRPTDKNPYKDPS